MFRQASENTEQVRCQPKHNCRWRIRPTDDEGFNRWIELNNPFRAVRALGGPNQVEDSLPSSGISSMGVAATKNPSIRILSISAVENAPGRTRHSDVAVSFTCHCVSLIGSGNGIGNSILSYQRTGMLFSMATIKMETIDIRHQKIATSEFLSS